MRYRCYVPNNNSPRCVTINVANIKRRQVVLSRWETAVTHLTAPYIIGQKVSRKRAPECDRGRAHECRGRRLRHIVDPRVPRYSTRCRKQSDRRVDEDRPRELTFPTHVRPRHLFRAGTICIRASRSALRSAAVKPAASGPLSAGPPAGREKSARKNEKKTTPRRDEVTSVRFTRLP